MATKSSARHRRDCRPATALTDISQTLTHNITKQKVGAVAVSAAAVAGVAAFPALADSKPVEPQKSMDIAQVATDMVNSASANDAFVNGKNVAWNGGETVTAKVDTAKIVEVGATPTAESGEAAAQAVDIPASADASQITQIALKFVGTPYAYGAKGPSAFDCSGFTAYVFAKVGISLPHQSEAQAAVMRGHEVSMSQARPGALMWKPGHVGIYLGNGMMIHASTPATGVTVSPVYANFTFFQP
ncbi:MAG: C40 family peptidase [Actinomycetaceae bacterium]|nr:C40 family peptidase [Actinomycetaceae bacterium]